MRPDDVGCGSPFAYYPTTATLIRDTADEVAARAGDLGTLRRQLDGGHRRALAGVGGELLPPLSRAPQVATANLTRVEQAAQFAAGVLRLFADAVDDYNHHSTQPRSVEALNLAYTEARLDDFGLAAAYTEGGAKASRDYDTDRNAAESCLLGSLTAEYQRLGAWLDVRAEQAARMLDRGPNAGDVTALWVAGALPPKATEIWPELDLVELPLLRLPYELRDDPGDRRSLHQLSQDELIELWEEYEFGPARELVADEIVHDFENMTVLREFNLQINLAYMTAMSRGMPERFARRLARVHPATLFDLVAPFATASELAYRITVGDLIDAVRNDPWSLRTLGEIAMVAGPGKVAKVRAVERTLEEIRDAERSADAAEETRTVAKIGGPKEFDPNSIKGMSADDVRASIPDNWSMKPSRSGSGEVYNDPSHRGRQLRIMPGYPPGSRPDPMTTGPYAVVSQNGIPPVKIPLAGNPTLGVR